MRLIHTKTVLAVTGLALSLAACGSDDDSGGSGESTEAGGTSAEGGGGDVAAFCEAVVGVEALVEVERHRVVGDQEDPVQGRRQRAQGRHRHLRGRVHAARPGTSGAQDRGGVDADEHAGDLGQYPDPALRQPQQHRQP